MSEEIPEENEGSEDIVPQDDVKVIRVAGMYQNWFLDYASYVILERAVPAGEDGLKPVQRRLLHALKEMDDGRFNKVANVIGTTMQFHPHGDASIGDAIVNIGQKELLLDIQGNWGDIRTGDSAAAPRYIEVRLSKFALEVLFNEDTTEWQMSYDGRKKEPINLPVKFPMVLVMGVDGIAVGLSTKIMPHNFIELIKASIKNGDELWKLRMKGPFSGSPVAAGKRIYAVNERGIFQVIDPEAPEGKVMQEIELKETVLTTPAISGGAIYVRSDAKLWKLQ